MTNATTQLLAKLDNGNGIGRAAIVRELEAWNNSIVCAPAGGRKLRRDAKAVTGAQFHVRATPFALHGPNGIDKNGFTVEHRREFKDENGFAVIEAWVWIER